MWSGDKSRYESRLDPFFLSTSLTNTRLDEEDDRCGKMRQHSTNNSTGGARESPEDCNAIIDKGQFQLG